jgi:L-2-hydroxyglutarate oxidase LhgO
MKPEEFDCDVIIVGGGIVGLGIGVGLLRQATDLRVTVLEAENALAVHGSGRNSGVLHAGFYYSPDSLKAKLTRVGNEMLKQLCHDEGVALRSCGKVVVTQSDEEIPRLEELHRRAIANGVTVEMVDETGLERLEPLARTRSVALWSPNTAVASPTGVTDAVARVFARLGGEIRTAASVDRIDGTSVILRDRTQMTGRHVVNAAGLYADRLAHSAGVGRNYEMLPFKGIYLYGNAAAPAITRHVYPVPDPRNPFLGVHLTVTVDGRVKIGPTAIPALSRQNYTKFGNIKLNELGSISLLLPQFLVSRHHNGLGLIRSEVPKYLRGVLVRHARELVPSVSKDSFTEWGKSGIRAQLFNRREKRLEMDFVVEEGENQTHVLNAVSPAWTGSLSFGEHVAADVISRL